MTPGCLAGLETGHSRHRREGEGVGVFSVEKLNVMAKARAKKLLAMLRALSVATCFTCLRTPDRQTERENESEGESEQLIYQQIV